MLLASGGWGPGMLPRVLQGTGHPLCGAALLRRSQLCGGRELALSPPGLSTWAASSEAMPCHMRGSRLRGGGAGGPEPGRRWGGRCRGLAASQVLGTRVTFQAVPSDAGLRTPPSLLPRP